MKKIFIILICLFLSAMLISCNSDSQEVNAEEEVTVFAAASLKDALDEIYTAFLSNAEHTKKVTFVYESSGTLQKQIQEGAPCDIFLSAAKSNMDALEQDNLIVIDTRKDLLGNKLTLVAAKDKANKITDITELNSSNVSKIAVGESKTVPAGKYAKESLNKLGLWTELEGKLVFAGNVRQVLTYVENGDVDYGIVYKTDEMLQDRTVSVLDLPEDSYSKIVYPAAVLADSKDKAGTKEFYEYLSSADAKDIFKKYGFTVY